jgi:hypothetical protein
MVILANISADTHVLGLHIVGRYLQVNYAIENLQTLNEAETNYFDGLNQYPL